MVYRFKLSHHCRINTVHCTWTLSRSKSLKWTELTISALTLRVKQATISMNHIMVHIRSVLDSFPDCWFPVVYHIGILTCEERQIFFTPGRRCLLAGHQALCEVKPPAVNGIPLLSSARKYHHGL